MYPGRAAYIFFLWLSFLEIILYWEKIQTRKITKSKIVRTCLIFSLFLLPTIYLLAYIAISRYLGMEQIFLISIYPNSPIARQMYFALSLEYIIFAVLFALVVLLAYKMRGIFGLQTPAFFLLAMGLIFLLDWAYPGGNFTPFQALVRPTATAAAAILSIMGYETQLFEIVDPTYGPLSYMRVYDPNAGASAGFSIAWPCAGVESLLLYTLTLLVFLQTLPAPKRQKGLYFAVGFVVTYFVNILRIVTIFLIALNKGDVWAFHNYYGWLYSVSWIVFYPLVITGCQRFLNRRGKSGVAMSFSSQN
ncbi:MAG: exosortase/archaeosortase family protein [Candidatus Bathyarchaeales archaeon]